MTKDPVCGMEVNQKDASSQGLCSDYQGNEYCFCGENCKQQFDENPQRYAERAA